MTLSYQGGQYYRDEVSKEMISRHLKSLEEFANWIALNFKVLSAQPGLSIRRGKRIELQQVLGRSFTDTALAAMAEGHVLLSDDGVFRRVANQELKIPGVNLQQLLQHYSETQVINLDQYYDACEELALRNIKLMRVDGQMLSSLLKKCEFHLNEKLRGLLQNLAGTHSDFSGIRVAVDLIYFFWTEPLLDVTKNSLLQMILDLVVTGRRSTQALRFFMENVNTKFSLLPVHRKQIVQTLKAWCSQKIIS